MTSHTTIPQRVYIILATTGAFALVSLAACIVWELAK